MNLNQITAPATDFEASLDFYKKLGLKLIVLSAGRYARFECPDGDATFSLHHTDSPPSGEGVWVYFECSDLDEKVGELRQQGFEFDLLPTDQTWLWREARLKDPSGNRLILFHAAENRKNPPWRL